VKLTELGLAFDAALAERLLGELLTRAHAAGTFVRIDMEDSRYTEATLAIFRRARTAHGNVGAVLQAALKRSAADAQELAREGAPVRLVKGAYREPDDVAFQRKQDVDAEYELLIDVYLANMADGAWLAIATHDERMVRTAISAIDEFGVDPARIEFQMLYGIRGDLQRRLRDEGRRVRVYVPYGTHWYPYLMRRLAERPANLWFFLRNALRRG
jgi:proline dehydrogenase